MAPAPSALIHNWRLKASALGLAIFLWALVQTEPRSQETLSAVPVRIEIGDTTWTLADDPSPRVVVLTLAGPAREIIRLVREGATVRVPVPRVGSQDTLITLRRDWVDLGPGSGLVVESVSPSAVRVSFEPALTRLVPLAPRLTGRVREHLALARAVTVSPQLVRVRGPQSRVAALDSLLLRPFDLERVSSSGLYTVGIDTTGLGGGTVSPVTATLEVRVEDMVERVLDAITVETAVNPGQADVVAEPSTIRLKLSGARTVVTSFDPAQLRVWIPPEFLEDMEPGEERRLPLRVDGVPELVRVEPATEFIRVRRAIDLPGGPAGAIVRGDRGGPASGGGAPGGRETEPRALR